MKRITFVLAVVLSALLPGCSTPSSVGPLSVPLEYKMMATPGQFPALPLCSAVSDVLVTDARTEPNLGTRSVEGSSAPAAAVTAGSDVAAWVRS
ncbi:MAG: hypothetical protein WBX15_20300, partial [Thermoanaerobaculia bacterium]